jgi:nucleoside-diphosphate-sugar epimerase
MTGASGYIGGSVAAALLASGHRVVGLVRSDHRAAQIRERGIVPVLGTLSDIRLLVQMTREADAVINAANADDRKSVEAMLSALVGSGKPFVQTSGSSIVADMAAGERGDSIYEDDAPVHPLPERAGRVAINSLVLSTARNSVRAIVVCPTLIYGRGHGVNPYSIQIPKMIALARKHGVAKHVGRGENIWSNVHIDDLVDLYLLVLDRAPAGAFYYAENGENSMREAAEAISRMLGLGGRTEPMSVDEAAAEWGESAVNYSFGSNSRVRATRARRELGWSPTRPALLDDIERGSYVETRS